MKSCQLLAPCEFYRITPGTVPQFTRIYQGQSPEKIPLRRPGNLPGTVPLKNHPSAANPPRCPRGSVAPRRTITPLARNQIIGSMRERRMGNDFLVNCSTSFLVPSRSDGTPWANDKNTLGTVPLEFCTITISPVATAKPVLRAAPLPLFESWRSLTILHDESPPISDKTSHEPSVRQSSAMIISCSRSTARTGATR